MADNDREALVEMAERLKGVRYDWSGPDREALADVIWEAMPYEATNNEATVIADAILGRWKLAPIEPVPPHTHRWEEISSAEQIEDGAHIFYCGGLDGCGKNEIQYDRG